MPYYEPDTREKIAGICRELAAADYAVLPTKRVYGSVTRAPQKFPLTSRYFYELFGGDLGFTLVKDFASRPSFLGIEFPTELADESFSVYDHPKVLIFRNTGHLAAAEMEARVVNGRPSRPLDRVDLLLASRGDVARLSPQRASALPGPAAASLRASGKRPEAAPRAPPGRREKTPIGAAGFRGGVVAGRHPLVSRPARHGCPRVSSGPRSLLAPPGSRSRVCAHPGDPRRHVPARTPRQVPGAPQWPRNGLPLPAPFGASFGFSSPPAQGHDPSVPARELAPARWRARSPSPSASSSSSASARSTPRSTGARSRWTSRS